MPPRIKGPVLTELEIKTINDLKDMESKLLQAISVIKNNPELSYNPKWMATGLTDIQKGFMCITRGISKNDR